MMQHDLVAFDIVAAGGGVRHVRDSEKGMGDAEFLEVGGVLEIELVVEALGSITEQDI